MPETLIRTTSDKTVFELAVEAIHSRLGDEQVNHYTDFNDLSRHDQQRRAVWVWDGGVVDGATHVGGELTLSDTERVTALYSDMANINLYVVAHSHYEMIRLWLNLLGCAKDVLGTASQPGSYGVPTQTPESAALVKGGAGLLIQTFTWNFAIIRPTAYSGGAGGDSTTGDVLTVITAATTTCEIDDTL